MFVQFRCPSCRKLFKASEKDLDMGESQFECPTCQTIFAFNYPGEIKPWILKQKKSDPKSLACPKCGALNSPGAESCFQCEALIFRVKENASPASDPELRKFPSLQKKWKEVLSRYEARSLHVDFIDNCDSLGALIFAEKSYQNILKFQPEDVLAIEMLELIAELEKSKIKVQGIESKFLGFLKKHWPVLLGSFSILIGFANINLRNMVGVGVGILFLHFGFKQLTPKSKPTNESALNKGKSLEKNSNINPAESHLT